MPLWLVVEFDALNANTPVAEKFAGAVRPCRGIRDSDTTAEAANEARIKQVRDIVIFQATT